MNNKLDQEYKRLQHSIKTFEATKKMYFESGAKYPMDEEGYNKDVARLMEIESITLKESCFESMEDKANRVEDMLCERAYEESLMQG